MAKPQVTDRDTGDEFLQKKDMRYEGGKTLDQKVKELGIKTKPLKLPIPESIQDD